VPDWDALGYTPKPKPGKADKPHGNSRKRGH
jgi:hypothetical protein